jgi:hypothetical protein
LLRSEKPGLEQRNILEENLKAAIIHAKYASSFCALQGVAINPSALTKRATRGGGVTTVNAKGLSSRTSCFAEDERSRKEASILQDTKLVSIAVGSMIVKAYFRITMDPNAH